MSLKARLLGALAIVTAVIAFLIVVRMEHHRLPTNQKRSSAATEARFSLYEKPYTNWIGIIERRNVEFQFWFITETNSYPYPTARYAAQLLAYDANLTPFVVEQMRKETNAMRLYIQAWLLQRISRINLIFRTNIGDPNKLVLLMPSMRDQLLREWGSGIYENPSNKLALVADDFRGELKPGRIPGRIDFGVFQPLKYYGIYGLPFVIGELKKENSVQFYSAFHALANLGSTDYGKRYKEVLVTHEEKLAVVKNWWAKHSSDYNQLHPLFENIQKEVSSIP